MTRETTQVGLTRVWASAQQIASSTGRDEQVVFGELERLEAGRLVERKTSRSGVHRWRLTAATAERLRERAREETAA